MCGGGGGDWGGVGRVLCLGGGGRWGGCCVCGGGGILGWG